MTTDCFVTNQNYFKFNEITDSESVKFRSKRYNYGFIENAPYDTVIDSKLSGINNKILTIKNALSIKLKSNTTTLLGK